MKLEPEQESILAGESGKAVALAMKTLLSYGEAFGAKRLVPIKSSHMAGSFGIVMFKSYSMILGRLVSEGEKVKVLTTINPQKIGAATFYSLFFKLERA